MDGLARLTVEALMCEIQRVARDAGLPSSFAEPLPQRAPGVTDDALVLDRGGIAYGATCTAALKDPTPLDEWLWVCHRTELRPAP